MTDDVELLKYFFISKVDVLLIVSEKDSLSVLCLFYKGKSFLIFYFYKKKY